MRVSCLIALSAVSLVSASPEVQSDSFRVLQYRTEVADTLSYILKNVDSWLTSHPANGDPVRTFVLAAIPYLKGQSDIPPASVHIALFLPDDFAFRVKLLVDRYRIPDRYPQNERRCIFAVAEATNGIEALVQAAQPLIASNPARSGTLRCRLMDAAGVVFPEGTENRNSYPPIPDNELTVFAQRLDLLVEKLNQVSNAHDKDTLVNLARRRLTSIVNTPIAGHNN